MRSRGADMGGVDNFEPVVADALGKDFVLRLVAEFVQNLPGGFVPGNRPGKLVFTDGAQVGEPDPEGGKNAGEGVYVDAFHAENIGDLAGVLPACAPKAVHRVLCHVISALNADPFDCVGHVFNRDAQESFGQRLDVHPGFACFAGDVLCHGLEPCPGSLDIQGIVAVWSEHGRELIRLDLSQNDVAVRYCQRAAAAVAGGARIGAGAFGANLHSSLPEGQC